MKDKYIEDFPVDIVYLWCDSSDDNWRKSKNEHLKQYGRALDSDSDDECRFLDNDELKYSLRSLEKFVPWINNIYIVTASQVPEWLDTTNAKIHMVNHEQILPKDCLPTFNASAIETGLHKIPGLSEHFLFANDDMFFGNFTDKSFFFEPDGKPVFRFSNRKIINKPYRHLYGYMISSAYRLVKTRYGKSFAYFPHHNIDAYKKSDIEKCCNEFYKLFEKTAAQKFREKDCIQRSVFGFYSVANNLARAKVINDFWTKSAIFLSKKPIDSVMFSLKKNKLKKIEKIKPYLFCLNDSIKTTEDDRKAMKEFLDRKFPYPSSFEKQEKKSVEVYICYHKKSENYLKNDAIIPVQSGSALTDADLGIAKDNTGVNISDKNRNYCELTVLYHLWKNSDADYAGLMHYRRIFDLSFGNKRWFNSFPNNIQDLLALNSRSINTILLDYDIIVPMKRVLSRYKSVYAYYKKKHFISDLDRVLEIIKEKYPQMYPCAVDVIKNNNELYLYNMFISSKEFLNEYASWLFDILSLLEIEIQNEVKTRDTFQQRVYGFLSERLFTVYIEYHKTKGLKVKEVPVAYNESDKKRCDIFEFRIKIYKILTALGYRKPHWREQYGV